MNSKDSPRFVIENKILKGRAVTVSDDKTLGERFLENLKKNPEFVGLIDAQTGETSTYRKLANDSVRCALWLKNQGINSGDVVTICSYNNIPLWATFCASFFIGANLNPWFYDSSSELAKYCLHLTKPKIIFASEKAALMLKELIKKENAKTKIIVFGKVPGLESFDDIIKQASVDDVERFQCTKVDPNHDSLMMFSSGSTGLPKGVQISDQCIYYNSYKWDLFFDEAIGKPATFTSTTYWISAILCMTRHLLFSCLTIVLNNPSPQEFCRAIEKYRIEWSFVGSGMTNEIALLEDLTKYNLSSLKYYVTGGSKIRIDYIKKIIQVLKNDQFTVGYGSTEVCGSATFHVKNGKKNYESTGSVFLDVELKVLDVHTGEILNHNQLGEIYLKNKYMMKHYFNNPQATAEAFTKDGKGWLRSGDLGYYNEDGNVFIKERLKEILKYRGHQISPAEIENVLLKHPEIIDAVVVSIPHPVDDEHPFAFIIKEKDSQITKEDVLQLTSILGETKKLRGGIVFLDTFPLNTSMKVDKRKLKEMAKAYAAK